MDDRSAVITTLNGEIIEWRVFDSPQQAMEQYIQGVGRLREMVQHTNEEGNWEVMLCEVKQYAVSKPLGERTEPGKSTDWYSRYLTIMSGSTARLRSIRSKYSLHLWRKLKDGVGNMFTDDDEPSIEGL